MDNQQQHHDAVTEDGADLQVAKTAAQLLFESDTGEQRLVHHQAGERGQLLIFEPDLRNAMGLAISRGFATLHADGLRWFYWLFWRLQFYQLRGRFFMRTSHLLASLYAVFWTSLLVKSSNSRVTSDSCCICAVYLKNSARFMQLSGIYSLIHLYSQRDAGNRTPRDSIIIRS